MPEPSHEDSSTHTAPMIRTVLGDVPANNLGIFDAHEHVIIKNSFIEDCFPEFLLDSVEAACVDVQAFQAAGGRCIVDTMPTGAGRNALKLREVSERTGVQIVSATGVHLEKYYEPDHPILKMDRCALTEMFSREIMIGIDDDKGITDVRAGVIKVAGGEVRLNKYQREVFIAAAQAQVRTGCPIITHCENGTAGLEQASLLERHGADLSHVVLSHCDNVTDHHYHKELLSTGVRLEYDQHFRQLARGEPCATVGLISELAPEFPEQILVGMDIARRRNWRGHGGGPGLAWLVTDLPVLLTDTGLDAAILQRVMSHNARSAFAMIANTHDVHS